MQQMQSNCTDDVLLLQGVVVPTQGSGSRSSQKELADPTADLYDFGREGACRQTEDDDPNEGDQYIVKVVN